jgi:hypothetical protein
MSEGRPPVAEERASADMAAAERLVREYYEEPAPLILDPDERRLAELVASALAAARLAGAREALEALSDLRDAATDAYKQGRIAAEPFVRAGNVLACLRASSSEAGPRP